MTIVIRNAWCLVPAILLAACGEPEPAPPDAGTVTTEPAGVRAFFDPTLAQRPTYAGTWLAFPFPADFRKTATGTIRLDDFPDPDLNPNLVPFVSYGQEQLTGFGTNAAVFVAFDGALDLSTIPQEANAFLAANAPIQLLDVTPGSPERGQRRPLRWEHRASGGKFVAGNSLAVAPAWGFPLREKTTYALIISNAVEGADGLPLQAPLLLRHLLGLEADLTQVQPPVPENLKTTLHTLFAPLRETLAQGSMDPASIAVATVFTTQDVTGELAAIHDQVNTTLAAPAPQVDGWRRLGGPSAWHQTAQFRAQSNSNTQTTHHIYEGHFLSPNYQQGTAPYASTSGGFNVVNGEPEVVWMESLRFVISVPAAPPANGAPCHPLVEVAHGTGGDAYSFVDDETAGRLAARGMAGIGLDQPLSTLRGNAADLTFNFLNPAAARTVLRQSAVDTFSLTRMIKEGLIIPASMSATGSDICFGTGQIGFFGHSQGGITGGIAAAFEPDINAWMLSGAGGGVSITIIEGNGETDLIGVVRLFLDVPQDEEMTELHPLIVLAQTLAEAADPINYAPYWVHVPGLAPPRSVMMTSGLADVYTPAQTATAMAVAARLPIVQPVVLAVPEYAWLGLEPVVSPVSANTGAVTTGFLQWGSPGDASHFLVFNRPETIHASMHFLETAVAGTAPVIERNAASTAR